MIYPGMMEEGLKGAWEIIPLSMSLYTRVLGILKGGKSEWAERISRDKDALLAALAGAIMVFESSWGIAYLDEYEPRWKVSAHGIVWGRECVRRGGEDIRTLAKAIFTGSDVLRIEIPLLGPARGVERVLAGAGFTREGTLRMGGVDGVGVVTDKTVWSMLRGEEIKNGK